MGSDIINMLYSIIRACMSWWNSIIGAVGLKSFWMGAIVIVMLFSIVLTPMRGGQLLGGGALGSFARNKIHNHRKNKNNSGGDD